MSPNHATIRRIGILTVLLSICFSTHSFAATKKKHAKPVDESYQEDRADDISVSMDKIDPNVILYIPDPSKDDPAITHFHAENTSSVIVQPSASTSAPTSEPTSTVVVQPKSSDATGNAEDLGKR